MDLNITPQKMKILILCLVLPLWIKVNAQTRVFASTVSFQSEVDAAPNAVDQSLTTAATVRANAGLIAGAGAYQGVIELQFGTVRPANSTVYVKIATQDNLLPFLLGGNLGGLLADVAGAVLIGNQEFTVQARDGATPVLTGDSQIATDFGGNRLRVVMNSAGEYFLMLTPALQYDRIRLTNRVGALVGLGNQRNLSVFGAFYVEDTANCGTPAFTSFSAGGVNLDAATLGGTGVQDPQFAIDANQNNHSTLSFGLLGVASSVEQTVYFEGASAATDRFTVRIRLAQTLLDLNVGNNIRIIAANGNTVVQNYDLNTLLSLNLLNLSGGQITTIPINPGAPVDRITVQFYSLVGLSVSQNLDLFGVIRTPAPPAITDPGTTNAQVCIGQTAALLATTSAGNELRFYNAATGGSLLETVTVGNAFTTPALTTTTTYYVAAAKIGCPEESLRVPITVTVITVPTPTTIDATQDFCGFTSPTIASLQVNEPGVVFYDAATAGNLLPSTTPLTNGTIYYAALTQSGCESSTRLAITVTLNTLCGVTLNLKVMLQGPLFGSTGGLMRDDLRQQGLIPLNQPYSQALSARFTHINGGGTEVTSAAVLSANAGTGNAIVDWVFVEVRDAANVQTVLKTASALVQRDGDIVAADGGPLNLDGLPQNFTVSIKHRNHLGALSTQVLTATGGSVTLDFTTIANQNLYVIPGTDAQAAMATVAGVRALYAGNGNFDRQVKYDGASNDRQVVASQVISHPGNQSQLLNYSTATGYFTGDVNLDGRALYDGANNDRQLILNIIITYPLNQETLSNYNGMFEQIPQ